MHSSKLLLRILWLAFVLGISEGLKCYHCQFKDGEGDEGCFYSPPPRKYLRECAEPQCWMKYSENGTMHIERFCAAKATHINGCIAAIAIDSSGHKHSGLECNCVRRDGCNGHTPNNHGAVRTGSLNSNRYHHYYN